MGGFPFRRALVTGASSGIGEAFAVQLATAGVPVVAVARRGDRLDGLAHRHAVIEPLVADLTTAEGVAAVCARIASGDIDLVVNNAGFGTSGSFVELDVDRLHREIELNVVALTRISHAALAALVPMQRGWLLNVSSVAGFQPAPGLAVYAATKSFVTSLTEALHEEVRSSGVQVCALCPGLTRTEFQSVSSAGDRSSSFPAFAWKPAEFMAERALSDLLAGRALSIPGLFNRLLVAGSSALPRSVVRRVSSLNNR